MNRNMIKTFFTKAFYGIDLLICSIFMLLICHTSYSNIPWIFIFIYPMLMRVNIDVMLYRKVRRVVRPILVFMLLYGLVMWYFIDIALVGWDNIVERIAHIYNEISGIELFSGNAIPNFKLVDAVLQLFVFWILFVPVLLYFKNRKHLTGDNVDWRSLAGEYLFHDSLGKKYLVLSAIFFIAYLLGLNMIYSLSMYGIMTLPVLAYMFINKYCGKKVDWWEYVIIIGTLLLFFYAQQMVSYARVIILSLTAVILFAICFRMYTKTHKLIVSFMTFLTITFILPLMIMGYNIYSGIDCARSERYTDKYIITGVYIVDNHHGKYGIRDRYRVIVKPQYNKIVLYDWESHLAKLTKGKETILYNIATGEALPFQEYERSKVE